MVEPGLGTKVLSAEVYNETSICSYLPLKAFYRDLRAVTCHPGCYFEIHVDMFLTRRGMSSVTSACTLYPSRALNRNTKVDDPSH